MAPRAARTRRRRVTTTAAGAAATAWGETMHCSMLNEAQIDRIQNASLRILERTGVVVPHADMLARLADAGALVDHAAQRVRIPPELVESSLRSAGKSFTLYGRDTAKTAAFGQGRRNYNSIAGEAYFVDEPGGPRRFATLADVATATRFADALEQITIPGSMADPHELPPAWRCVEVMAAMLRNTTKPITFWYHDRASARFLNDMVIAVRGDERRAAEQPLCFPLLEPISPLRFPFHGVDVLYETARLNLPVPIGPMAQMGVSAPMSLAGTMAVENAEILAGVVLTQMVRPGMPVCYGGICHAFDMRTTQMIFSGPEQAIFGVAMTQMGRRHGLPVYINVGLTDSKRPDAQAGLEAGITLALGAAAGADIFGHMGISGVDQASSLDMLVLQDEVIAFVEQSLREPDLSDEAIGLDVIEELGPGGMFLEHDHTYERFRSELWQPHLLDRQFYQAWLDAGAVSTEERCRRRKEEILATHVPEPLPDELEREIGRIVGAAKRELGA
ncbi:MAG: trimethylamine methyltransferase family protein [Armatimonadetes bacterium]|nr:trimethylamine methyltransferase family protein [Armatimonadota bacterium]